MNVVLSRVTVAVALVLGLSSAALAREAGPQHRGVGKFAHGIGFKEPGFGATLRTVKDQPYTWPVSDRYRPVSQPYYGRAY